MTEPSMTTPERGDEEVVREALTYLRHLDDSGLEGRCFACGVRPGSPHEITCSLEAVILDTEPALNRMVAELERLRERQWHYETDAAQNLRLRLSRAEAARDVAEEQVISLQQELTDLRRQVEGFGHEVKMLREGNRLDQEMYEKALAEARRQVEEGRANGAMFSAERETRFWHGVDPSHCRISCGPEGCKLTEEGGRDER